MQADVEFLQIPRPKIMLTEKTSQAGCSNTLFQPTRIQERVLDRTRQLFLASPFVSLRHLRFEFNDNELIIQGSVTTFYVRQVALTLAKKIEGVDQIVDRITVTEAYPN